MVLTQAVQLGDALFLAILKLAGESRYTFTGAQSSTFTPIDSAVDLNLVNSSACPSR